jgi:S1-C subfamily serine protease
VAKTEVPSAAGDTVVAAPAPRTRIRDRIIPRSVLGLSVLILFTALGAAFSGAVLYSYYQYKLDQNDKRISSATLEATKAFKNSKGIIDAETEDAKKQIREQLGPVQQLVASEATLKKLIDKVGPSTWFVQTLDENGAPSVGTAFVVAADGDQSFLVTSYSTVRAATRAPGPEITVRHGGDSLKATLRTWQEERDLALLVIPKPNQPKLDWAEASSVKLGERVFSVAGVGGAGASITQGYVADVFADGVQHTAAVGTAYQGGPLIDSTGAVVGVSSRAYGPLGFTPGEVSIAVPIRKTCDKVLRCP